MFDSINLTIIKNNNLNLDEAGNHDCVIYGILREGVIYGILREASNNGDAICNPK